MTDRPPAPANRAEQMRRANEALPAGLAIKYAPRGPAGRRPDPFRVLMLGREIGSSSSLEGAIFRALRHRDDPRLDQPQLPFQPKESPCHG